MDNSGVADYYRGKNTPEGIGTMNITCRGCKKDSGAKGGAGSIGAQQTRSGFIWIPSASDMSIWLCPKCAEKLLGFAQGITNLMGDLYIYPATLQDILQRSVGKSAKAKIRK